MNIIATRYDVEQLPNVARHEFLDHLSATIYRKMEDGEIITDTTAIEHYGYTLADFPDAPTIPWVSETQEKTIPTEIPAWRGQAVMAAHGHLPAVLAAIDNLPEDQRAVAQIAWNAAAPWARNGQTVGMIAAAIGLSDTEIDALFLEAMHIQI